MHVPIKYERPDVCNRSSSDMQSGSNDCKRNFQAHVKVKAEVLDGSSRDSSPFDTSERPKNEK
jgi:hypothetical protein